MSQDMFIAPDGGYGWIIIIGNALCSIISIPIIQSFGMIYGPLFERLGVSATKTSFIINVNQAFGMIMALFNGPLLRIYGYRKMAILGSLLMSSGFILTSFAKSFVPFIIAYGMMASLGMGMSMSAGMLALNTYFREKRGRAVGVSMTIIGLGSIIMPQLTSYLLTIYDSQGTMLILAGLSLNSLVGALLLQPIKWHAKRFNVTQNNEDNNKNGNTKKLQRIATNPQESLSLLNSSTENSINNLTLERKNKLRRTRTLSTSDYDDNISVYGLEIPISLFNSSVRDFQDLSFDSKDYHPKLTESSPKKLGRSSSVYDPRTPEAPGYHEFSYDRSVSYNEAKAREHALVLINNKRQILNSSISHKTLDECPEEETDSIENDVHLPSYNEIVKTSKPSSPVIEEKPTLPSDTTKSTSLFQLILLRIIRLFDLGLLHDPVYVNIMLGLTVSMFAEINFSVLLSFALAKMNLSPDQVAMTLSVLASADLTMRAISPLVSELLGKPPRVMFLISIGLLFPLRLGLLYAKSYTSILIAGVGLGIAKGFRTVNMALIIPEYVPLERLASAGSIQSTVNGLFLLLGGSSLGVIKDLTGSYNFCILFLNFISLITIVLWLGEYAIKRTRINDGESYTNSKMQSK